MRSLSRISRLLTALLAGGLAYMIIVASIVTSAAPTADIQPSLPLRAAFYYSWFPGVWRQYGIYPYTVYHPTAGCYDSSDPAIIQQHLAAMQYGGIQAGISLLSYSSQVNLLRFRTAADGSIVYLYVDTAGRLNLHNDAGASTVTSSVSVGSGWHALELHAVINGASSTTEVWLDGVKINALSVTTNLGTTGVGRFQIGEVLSGRTYNVVFDDAVFNTQRIGP